MIYSNNHKTNNERALKLKMYQCPNPSCLTSGFIKELKENKKVWAKCYKCKTSGSRNRIDDDEYTIHVDVFATLYDIYNISN